LNDILKDENGLSFHRCNRYLDAGAGLLFFYFPSIIKLVMPEFSATLLTLQGVVAGTYLGFKFPEKQG